MAPPELGPAAALETTQDVSHSENVVPEEQTERRPLVESQPSILEIDRSVHRSLPAHARRGSLDRSGHGGGSIDRSGYRRRANRKGSLDSAASSLGSYNDTSVRVPLPLPQKTWRESKASDTKTFPESGRLRLPMMKNHMSASVSMRTTIPQTSEEPEEVLPTTTATSSPSEDAKVEEIALVGGGREAMGPPCVQEEAPACSQQQVDEDEEAASVGAASLHSSSTSSGGLLLADYPRFRPSEVKVGQVLGKGSFGVVREVLAFDIDDEPQTSTAGGYQSTARLFAWASSGRSIVSGRSIASGGSLRESAKVATRSASVDLIATSVDMAPPSSFGRTSNDAASRDAVTLFASVCGDGGSRDGISYTASLKDHSGGLFSNLREPGGQPVDDEKRVRRVSISEIAIHAGSADRDSEIKTDDFSSGPEHQHCNRKASLNSSVGSMSHCQRRNRKASLDSTRTFQSGISSARSVAFGIDGRTFLARHCIRDVGKSAGNTSMRHVKSQNVFRRQQDYESRRSVESHGSHESASTGSISVTRSRVLARLGLAPSMSSSGGSRFVFKRKKKGLLRRKGEGDCRYAVKSLRDEVLGNPEVLEMALLDIQNETRILASVEHPNIVKMRAFSANDDDNEEEEGGRAKFTVNRGPRGYFIVLDRLYDTLEQRTGLWSHRLQMANRPTGWMTRSKVQREVWEQRLVVAYDLASALEYMHSMGIAYRDLKPQNCAFDVRGDIKLYDFGLSKELNLTDMSANGTFEPSSVVGALRYMPPEVFHGEPYNLSVDTFSFSVVLWEILSLAKPYGELGLGPAGHQRQVIDGGLRPPLPEYWSEPLREMMRSGWSADISVRPPMSAVLGTLKWELASVRDDMAEGVLNHDRRRSTFVMMKQMQNSGRNLKAGGNDGERRRSIFRKMKA